MAKLTVRKSTILLSIVLAGATSGRGFAQTRTLPPPPSSFPDVLGGDPQPTEPPPGPNITTRLDLS